MTTCRARAAIAAACLVFLAWGCSNDPSAPTGPENGPVDPPVVDTSPLLLDASHLTSGLFGWPERDFGRGNAATIEIFRHAGDPAVDFTLVDVDGNPTRLKELLAERPVLLVLGSFT